MICGPIQWICFDDSIYRAVKYESIGVVRADMHDQFDPNVSRNLGIYIGETLSDFPVPLVPYDQVRAFCVDRLCVILQPDCLLENICNIRLQAPSVPLKQEMYIFSTGLNIRTVKPDMKPYALRNTFIKIGDKYVDLATVIAQSTRAPPR